MFYKFCGLTGKLAPTTQLAAYQPQGLTPYSGHTSKVVFDSSQTKPVYETSAPVRSVGTGSLTEVPTGSEYRGMVPAGTKYQKLQKMQTQMLMDDGKLVWQKLPRDKPLYYISLGIMFVGTIFTVHSLYQLVFPKKKDQ